MCATLAVVLHSLDGSCSMPTRRAVPAGKECPKTRNFKLGPELEGSKLEFEDELPSPKFQTSSFVLKQMEGPMLAHSFGIKLERSKVKVLDSNLKVPIRAQI